MTEQYARLGRESPYAKGRLLYAAWNAGAPIGGFPLPRIGPRTPSPRTLIDGLTGPARRSVAVRLFLGELDLAAYSGNWDLASSGRYIPRRACAHCYWRIHGPPSVEDEWHVLLICPLYAGIRRGMPFSADELCIEGHPHQGDGCTPRNLERLIGAILRTPRFTFIIDYLIRAFKIRRQQRKPPPPPHPPRYPVSLGLMYHITLLLSPDPNP